MVGWLLYVVVGFVMLYQHVVKYHEVSKWLAVSCCMQMYIETSCHIYKWLFSSFEMIWNHVGNGKVFRVLSGHFSDDFPPTVFYLGVGCHLGDLENRDHNRDHF